MRFDHREVHAAQHGVAPIKDATEIAAPVETVFAAIVDFAAYPKWAKTVSKVDVKSVDEETGLAKQVEFVAGTLGVKISVRP